MKYQMIDLTGQRFGKLTAIKPDHSDNKRGWWWLCHCDCGNTKIIPSGNLRSGSTISCGCYFRNDENKRAKDLTGQRFGRLVVVSRAEDSFTPSGRKIIRWNCECDCGNHKIVDKWHLTSGKTISCGCYRHERQIEANTHHGDSHTRLHYIWAGIKQRCKDKNNLLYGGRGITYCEEWEHYENFKEWALENGYQDNLTIDRKDNNGNYCPENCRWVTLKVQANNTRKNHYITMNGETHSMSEWCDILNLNYDTVKDRINRLHWNDVEALTTPIQEHRA